MSRRKRSGEGAFLICHSLKGVRVYDLIDTLIYLALRRNPGRIAEELTPRDRVVVIDEKSVVSG